jgi:hypothetical protein
LPLNIHSVPYATSHFFSLSPSPPLFYSIRSNTVFVCWLDHTLSQVMLVEPLLWLHPYICSALVLISFCLFSPSCMLHDVTPPGPLALSLPLTWLGLAWLDAVSPDSVAGTNRPGLHSRCIDTMFTCGIDFEPRLLPFSPFDPSRTMELSHRLVLVSLARPLPSAWFDS